MDLETVFCKQGVEQGWWQPQKNILIAVSTGVDSMVLLTLMEKIREKIGCKIAVAHINHQIRDASIQEEAFLAEYCQSRQIPFYHKRWENPPTVGMENAARKFRYAFFQEVMEQGSFDLLLTAHHSDDQMETMLMKILRDGTIKNSMGIRDQQSFGGGKLVRPLLQFSKETIRNYAKEHRIEYFEDATNALLDVQRNRLRHQVVPLLKKENAQAAVHFQKLSQQLIWADELLTEQQKNWFDKYVSVNDQWQFAVSDFMRQSEAARYFSLQYFFSESRHRLGVETSEAQLKKILYLLADGKAQWSLDFSENWQAVKSYDTFALKKIQQTNTVSHQILKVGESLFLSENEWLAIWPIDQEEKIPEKVKLWSEFSQLLSIDFPRMVMIRKRESGDRIQLTPTLRKKVNRIFIDKKISNDQRERAWVIEDEKKQILGILPIVFSYLSIAQETDKIHYRLLYKYRE
ncbi:tRNA lysidine(34) synthetase TilS [Enterococcus mediterraneensis]|uniref:tRNA lysidine(34) synthetase TilS n=1 Tax=Enterococcus mediterraneensis TaxID=2364791 RepID=UPI001F152F44|nr:tRNA lysidine(34) synthetase TilS [Enterococcus mediterraneensis]